METSSNISSTCVPSTTIAGAGQHSFNRLLAYYVPHTENVGLPTKVRFNVGPASQTIAGSMPAIVNDAGPTLIYLRVCCILCSKHVAFNQCCLNVDPVFDAGPSLKQPWVIVPCFLTAALCWWRFNIPAPETPDNTIHWPNADVMWATVCDTGPTLFQTKPFKLLTTNIIVTIFFLNTC